MKVEQGEFQHRDLVYNRNTKEDGVIRRAYNSKGVRNIVRRIPRTSIILFTSHEENLSQTEASKAGISLLLEKTVPFSTVIEKAHELMGN
jgi:hypothetical protein